MSKEKVPFNGRILVVGFGIIGQALIPLLFEHLKISPEQITIVTKDNDGLLLSQKFEIPFHPEPLTPDNYTSIVTQYLKKGDFLLNVSVDVSSLDLLKLCRKEGYLYLDLCIEPWAGFYDNKDIKANLRTNFALREEVMQLKEPSGPTAVIAHGANPGLVSHFVKQALLNLAQDNQLSIIQPKTSAEWASLAKRLGIKVIHIAERDTQVSSHLKQPGEFVNTWSVDGFISEGLQPPELSWGTHERHWPSDAFRHDPDNRAIFLNRPSASVKVRSWTPNHGSYHGYLITHIEAISIAEYLTVKEAGKTTYCPTVHYAYLPSPLAQLSVHELAGNEWEKPTKSYLSLDDIVAGSDALGVLLMGNERGAYWYGSQLSVDEARKICSHNNATTLQVAAGTIAGIVWAIEHPERGIVEPEDMDFDYILNIARPYLGTVGGYYTDWTPIKQRELLFEENIDETDPWQFLNIRVS